jgi:uncharacterized protein
LTSIADVAVTKIVDRVPRAGMQAQLERAIQELTQACMRFPGYLGMTVLRPVPPAHPAFRLIYKFASSADLRAWEASQEQHRLVACADLYTDGAPRHHLQSGLEAWFTPAAAPFPSRAKLTFVSWLGVFPLVLGYASLAGHVLPLWTPAAIRILIVTALAVPTMSYLVGPWLTRLFRRWLSGRVA